MRLFGTVTGTVTRFDRAEWLTPIFDLALGAAVVVEVITVTVILYVPNADATAYVPNPNAILESTA